MCSGSQSRRKPDIPRLIVQNIHCESVVPRVLRRWRGQHWRGGENNVGRSCKIVKILNAGNTAIDVLEINGEGLVISLRAGSKINSARNEIQFLPVLQVPSVPVDSVALILALK